MLSLSFDPSFNAVSDLPGGAGIPGNLDATARWIASAKLADWHQLQMAPRLDRRGHWMRSGQG